MNCSLLGGPDDAASPRLKKYPNHDDMKLPPSLLLSVFTSCAPPSVVARPSFALRFFVGLLLLSFMVCNGV
eukprot:scaffold12911_cov135-Skeletonema_marinoi.AAC.4